MYGGERTVVLRVGGEVGRVVGRAREEVSGRVGGGGEGKRDVVFVGFRGGRSQDVWGLG